MSASKRVYSILYAICPDRALCAKTSVMSELERFMWETVFSQELKLLQKISLSGCIFPIFYLMRIQLHSSSKLNVKKKKKKRNHSKTHLNFKISIWKCVGEVKPFPHIEENCKTTAKLIFQLKLCTFNTLTSRCWYSWHFIFLNSHRNPIVSSLQAKRWCYAIEISVLFENVVFFFDRGKLVFLKHMISLFS